MTTAGPSSGDVPRPGSIGRHDVFISYSRSDRDFVVSLNDGLQRRERDAWVDWEGIPPTAEWMSEVERAIASADNFVSVMSPASMSSRICNEEVSHALALNKRIIPVVPREPDPGSIPGAIGALNWIFFRAEDDFETAVDTLIDTLDTDLRMGTGTYTVAGTSAGLGRTGPRQEPAGAWQRAAVRRALAHSAARGQDAGTERPAYAGHHRQPQRGHGQAARHRVGGAARGPDHVRFGVNGLGPAKSGDQREGARTTARESQPVP